LGNRYRKIVKYISYDNFLKSRKLNAGTYIFSDIERLPLRTSEWAEKYWLELDNSELSIRLFNNPLKVMRRYELLRNLYENQSHNWNVYYLKELRWPTKYPVFLRRENDHDGPITDLIYNCQDLESEIKLLTQRGYSREDIIITEFCDTKDSDGIYKKYGAFYLGGKIIRRHVFFSDNWMVKYPKFREDKFLKEEMDYIQSDAHEVAIREIFELANIDHGRIDYGLVDGKIQVWEINTNPHMVYFEEKDDPRSEVNSIFFRKYVNALEEIDLPSQNSIRCQVDNPEISEWSIKNGKKILKSIIRRLKAFTR
jgi:hypothetical protein